ncbi:MAG: tetraacyldisaccharide 4'-kinase [Gemmatimonadota bacterium]|nr:MAG: tetraacyldisaccharide 4'-kinase [Gemmatimonadota bacterium]
MIYIFIVQIRLRLYGWGIFKRRTLEARVISIGNITLGGAGKTPVVAYLAGHLQGKNCQVGILSRGYKRHSKGLQIVSDGQTVPLSWPEAGDEPYFLARRLPGIPVIVGADRTSAGRHGIDRFGVNTLILDDGFQHLKLHRDLDIVVIDASYPFGNGRVIPAGHLREPLKNLKRADLFWLTRVDQAEDLDSLRTVLHSIQPDASIVHSIYHPIGLRCCTSGSEVDLSILKGSKTALLCGIANPISFQKTVASLGADILERFSFPDHHPFAAAEIQKIQKAASDRGAKCLVTTEKDGIRMPQGGDALMPLYELIIELRITHGEDILEEILWNEMHTKSCPQVN